VNISLYNVCVTCRTASFLVGQGVLSTVTEPPGSVPSNPRNTGLCVSKCSGLQMRDRLLDLIHGP
jgi:hypothetical protein